MGMFDYVIFKCPHCGTLHEDQSKSGDCTLSCYTLQNLPESIARDFVGSTIHCQACLNQFTLEVISTPRYKVVKKES